MARKRLNTCPRTPLETAGYKTKKRKMRNAKIRRKANHVARVLRRNVFDEKKYEIDVSYRRPDHIKDVHTISDLVRLAEKDKSVQIEADVLHLTTEGMVPRRYGKKKFIETFKSNPHCTLPRVRAKRFREAIDTFLRDEDDFGTGGRVGEDFIPLLGGPFNKQLYYYDFLRATSVAFHAWNHDAVAKRIVQLIKYFVLGKGFRVDVAGKDKDKGIAVWRAFEEVNDLETLLDFGLVELIVYGEILLHELPDGQTKVEFDIEPGQESPKGSIPRYRLVDPSTCWEIVTFPEDITRVLYYQLVFPTQYQMYTGKVAGKDVGSTKFVIQQIPGNQMLHYKINTVSNEKRGRSDLFAVLGHLKRLRDSVNYQIVADQKNSAWGIDTTVKGSQADIDRYVDDQNRLGSIAPAGSEFVHTEAIKREYNCNAGAKSGTSSTFDWVMDLIAAGSGIPTAYFGFHHSGGNTRAGALVATEPVAKMFEDKQKKIGRMIKDMGKRLFKSCNLDCELTVTFPEIVTQDRSAKIKDIISAKEAGLISEERAGNMLAEEFDADDYEWTSEKAKIDADRKAAAGDAENPLVDPPKIPPADAEPGEDPADARPSAVTKNDRRAIKLRR